MTSTVVAFQLPKASAPAEPRGLNGPAQVLLFTGVRYERLELRETAPPRAEPSPAGAPSRQ